MFCKSLLPVVFLAINNFDSEARNEVEGAHEMVPFRSSWFGSVEKTRQVEEMPNNEANKEVFAEFSNMKPRKIKTKETFTEKTDQNFKKSHKAAKKKKKRKRKSKKKPASMPRRFIKTTDKHDEAEREKESNLTDSIEVTKRTKPVDIIVHIKVSD